MKNTAIDLSLIERQDLMNTLLHCADISGPGKPWEIHEKWTLMLMQEFFAQGDREKAMGIPISPLCDRTTTNIPDSQIGFITYITHPAFSAMGDSVDAILRDKQERDFLELTGTRAQNRRGTIFQQALSHIAGPSNSAEALPPIEETKKHHEISMNFMGQRPSSSPLAQRSFDYKPINRIWDKNFIDNRNSWQNKKDANGQK